MQVWPLFCVLFGLRSLSFSNSQQNILLYLKVLLRQFPFRIKMSVPFLAVDAISQKNSKGSLTYRFCPQETSILRSFLSFVFFFKYLVSSLRVHLGLD